MADAGGERSLTKERSPAANTSLTEERSPTADQNSTEEQNADADTEYKNHELEEFTHALADAYPELFGSKKEGLALFAEADKEFMSATDSSRRLSSACTFTQSSRCWAVDHQKTLNCTFIRRGIQFLELHIDRLHFRTLNVDPKDIATEGDVKFVCVCLWLLRNHRCISSVSISIPVAAPRHGFVFTNMLRLTESLEKLEIHCEIPLEPAPTEDSATQAASSAARREHRWKVALDSALNLRELVLSSVKFLSDEDACALITCVQGSELFDTLVLIDVQMNVKCFLLLQHLTRIKEFRHLRLKVSGMKPEETFAEALSVIGMSLTLSTLYVHTDHDFTEMLQGLRSNATLRELTLGRKITKVDELAALREYVCGHVVPMRVKVRIAVAELWDPSGDIDHLEVIIKTSCVRTMVLTGSSINRPLALRIAESLAESELSELHLDDCNIECEVVEHFARVISKRKDNFKELNVGTPCGEEAHQREMFASIVKAEVCGKITLVYTDCLVKNYEEWNNIPQLNHFTKVSLCYGQGTLVDPVLESLRNAEKTLESLSISTTEGVSSLAAVFLVHLIRNCAGLKVLRLRCGITQHGCLQILGALAKSRSVVVLTVEHWPLTPKVAEAFAGMLRENRSLHKLEFYWKDIAEFQEFSPFLTNGIALSRTVAMLKMYLGPQYDEIVPLDESLLLALQRNEMILSWTTKVIFRDWMAVEGAVLADLLDICDAPLEMYRRKGGFSARTTRDRVRWARTATRPEYYALRQAFPEPVDRYTALEGQKRLQDLMLWAEISAKDDLKNAGLAREA